MFSGRPLLLVSSFLPVKISEIRVVEYLRSGLIVELLMLKFLNERKD